MEGQWPSGLTGMQGGLVDARGVRVEAVVHTLVQLLWRVKKVVRGMSGWTGRC